jgi:hypothetical protein
MSIKPEIEKKKVFCCDCKYLNKLYSSEGTIYPVNIYACEILADTWLAPKKVPMPPEEKNKNNDCPNFEAKQ